MDKGIEKTALCGRKQNVQTFDVTAKQEGSNLKFGLRGQCRLKIGNGYIVVQNKESKVNIDWRLRDVRHFCHTPTTFSLVAGTRSSTGEGKFTFSSDEALEIVAASTAEVSRLARETKNAPPAKPSKPGVGNEKHGGKPSNRKAENDEHLPVGRNVSGASSNTASSRGGIEEKIKDKKGEEGKKKAKTEKKIGKRGVHHYEDPDLMDYNDYSETEHPYAETGVDNQPLNFANSAKVGQVNILPGSRFPFVPQPGLESSMYTQVPQSSTKKPILGREVVHAENYESASRRRVVPAHTPQWRLPAEEPSNRTYDHITMAKTQVPKSENVYGMGSASKPFKSAQEVDTNIYEDTGAGAYKPESKKKNKRR